MILRRLSVRPKETSALATDGAAGVQADVPLAVAVKLATEAGNVDWYAEGAQFCTNGAAEQATSSWE